jgi:phage/plasmid-associated DNA primase
VQAKNSKENSTLLFQAWRRWADSAGEFVGSQKLFSQNLEARGFTPKKGSEGNYFVGLKLLSMEGEHVSDPEGVTGRPSKSSSTRKYAAARLALVKGGATQPVRRGEL